MDGISSWVKESWAVVWKMHPNEYEANPELRFWADNLTTREEAVEMMNECIRNPRCAAVAVVRHVERYTVDTVFPGGGNADC